MVCSCLMAIAAILYFLFDANYFLRMLFTIAWGRLFQKKAKVMDETSIYGLCILQDADLVMKHMNNARYLRELDFARMHYLDRTGMLSLLTKMGATVVLGASSTRYRRPIPLFMPYKVTTKLIYWDEKSLYFEHKFVNLRNNFVHAVMLTKQTTIGLKVPLTEFIDKIESNVFLPALENDLRLWIESMEHSSQKLRKKD